MSHWSHRLTKRKKGGRELPWRNSAGALGPCLGTHCSRGFLCLQPERGPPETLTPPDAKPRTQPGGRECSARSTTRDRADSGRQSGLQIPRESSLGGIATPAKGPPGAKPQSLLGIVSPRASQACSGRWRAKMILSPSCLTKSHRRHSPSLPATAGGSMRWFSRFLSRGLISDTNPRMHRQGPHIPSSGAQSEIGTTPSLSVWMPFCVRGWASQSALETDWM